MHYDEGDLPADSEPNPNYAYCQVVNAYPLYHLVMRDYKTAKTIAYGVHERECPIIVCKAIYNSLWLIPRAFLLTPLTNSTRPMGSALSLKHN